jgi:hypothetical protein
VTSNYTSGDRDAATTGNREVSSDGSLLESEGREQRQTSESVIDAIDAIDIDKGCAREGNDTTNDSITATDSSSLDLINKYRIQESLWITVFYGV